MAVLYITEFPDVGASAAGHRLAALPLDKATNKQLTFTASAASSSALRGDTRVVRLVADAACAVKVGAGATSADTRLQANVEYDFIVDASSSTMVISAITV